MTPNIQATLPGSYFFAPIINIGWKVGRIDRVIHYALFPM
jgi:hypothetical protein